MPQMVNVGFRLAQPNLTTTAKLGASRIFQVSRQLQIEI